MNESKPICGWNESSPSFKADADEFLTKQFMTPQPQTPEQRAVETPRTDNHARCYQTTGMPAAYGILLDLTRQLERENAELKLWIEKSNTAQYATEIEAERDSFREKSEALDWLSSQDFSLCSDPKQPMRFSLVVKQDGVTESIHESVSSPLSAIQQAMKEESK